MTTWKIKKFGDEWFYTEDEEIAMGHRACGYLVERLPEVTMTTEFNEGKRMTNHNSTSSKNEDDSREAIIPTDLIERTIAHLEKAQIFNLSSELKAALAHISSRTPDMEKQSAKETSSPVRVFDSGAPRGERRWWHVEVLNVEVFSTTKRVAAEQLAEKLKLALTNAALQRITEHPCDTPEVESKPVARVIESTYANRMEWLSDEAMNKCKHGDKLYTTPQPQGVVVNNSLKVPDGWKLAPIEPTEEMYQAGQAMRTQHLDGLSFKSTEEIYKAMLAAAPESGEVNP